MTDVVNLNKFRKDKRKQAETAKARENRIVHGLSKAQKEAVRLEAERAQVRLEKMRREQPAAIKSVDDSQ
jgi:hypothetical protein